MICTAGAESLLKMMMRATTSDVSAGGNWYVGICGADADADDTLADVAGEPSAAGGYARKALTRDATGFPTISQVNGVWRALSAPLTWTASGAAFDATVNRLFLCNVSSGTSGILYAYSGVLASAVTVADGQSYQATFSLFFD